MTPDTLLAWLHEREIDFRAPQLLWGLALVPMYALAYLLARRARRRVAGAFFVRGLVPRPRARLARGISLLLLLLGLAAVTVGFARPVTPLETPDDKATVVFVLDASTAMRATDVKPTRMEAARATARAALAAVPERAQVALVAYSQTAYVLVPPTHDHGAVGVALAQVRTADGAALGDALAVALATIPQAENPSASDTAAPASQEGPPSKVPAAIVLLGSGEVSAGRAVGEAAAGVQQAHVPVYTMPIGPRQGQEQKAPYDPDVLRQVAQATGGRSLSAPSSRDLQQLFGSLGSAVTVRRVPQDVGHYAGAAGLAVSGLAMLVSLFATRRPI